MSPVGLEQWLFTSLETTLQATLWTAYAVQ